MKKYIFVLLVASSLFYSCSKEETDTTKPEIDLDFPGAFPQNCDVIYFDEEFTLKIRFTDDTELGSFSLDLHNNFDHHTHSTEAEKCDFHPDKDAINPYKFVQDYSIPEGSTEYIFEQKMTISSQNANGQVDDGDYHLYIRLTDRTGWSSLKGLSLKILNRD